MKRYNAFPFVVTIDAEADGGPDHFVYILRDYQVELLSNGLPVAQGKVMPSFADSITIENEYGETATFDLWNGSFDEIRYL